MADRAIRAVARDDFALVSLAARRGAAAALAATVRRELGATLPVPGTWTAAGDLTCICTAPGQWLVMQARDDGALLARLTVAVQACGLLIDLSDSRVAVCIAGAGAREVLAKGLPLDLHPRAMRAGDAAATVAAHVPVLVRQLDDAPTYELMCARSLAGSLHRWLALAGAPVAAGG